MQFSTYLYFDGNCEEAFKFYEKHLGGKIEVMMPHEGTPAAEQTPANWLKKILHARMSLGDGQLLMASDAPPGHFSPQQGFSINVQVNDTAEAERVFATLSESGKILMPIAETFWATRFGMLVDRFGIPWMVNYQKATS